MLTLKANCMMVIAKNKKQMKTIKGMDYNWTPAPESLNNQDVSVPRAVFIPHSNSLPFEERRVTLEQPVKIGRNVYRSSPSPTNTIFECRVLSRHHATLYYDKGHFYLVDNQSSNGTFVNNNRYTLAKEPHEVFSGDIVQFGIPVVENAGNSEKNTFPPVVALLKLYHPDGQEAKLSFNPAMTTPLHLKELYQLNNFVQEAIQREASLESRLRTLRECVERTRAEAAASWELFVGEQRLLMRVHTMEAMLAAGKNPDAHHVAQLLTDKRNYQEVAQESLRTAHEQRLALEESLERRSREAAALHHHNYALRLAASDALQELQKLAARCDRKMCAARLAVAAAEEREQTLRKHLPLAYSVQNGEAKMLVVSTDSNKLQEAKRNGSLEDAVRALPDYIKLLLPQHLLNKVGIKAISAEGKSAKEFELILKQNNIYNFEEREKQQTEEGSVGGSGEKPGDSDLCTDDEKHSRLNHDTTVHEVESLGTIDGEIRPDNNANSTYSEPDLKEDSPGKGGVEYANILRVMAGLNEEIKALRERVSACTAENDKLRDVRDELLAAQHEPRPHDDEDVATYRARLADLQEKLTKSTVAEEAKVAEIQRLATNAAEMQAELAFRPTRADIDDLTAVVGKLRADVLSRDQQIERLQAALDEHRNKVDRAVETSTSLEDLRVAVDDTIDEKQISAKIDEMFNIDDDDDDDEDEETDSAVTEIDKENGAVGSRPDTVGVVSEYLRLDDEERLQVTMQNGTLHALEEELVRAKERWAEVCAERARLAAQLATVQNKPLRLDLSHAVALAVPVLVAILYYLLLPYVS
ncbi:sarcolemmal membrane-associated protein [Vanessa tameamea]|uniref:Sarcolemmal membrane-associated protein n=1 Tax=Vanessa tameamea TaxID=334116 RepID=A0A8B8IQZ4_VANTA|nr:sarcolemmal membrane-associated protein [Vanessa tameamea]XP_026499551.1 sarcolemmal membrane-associated protein [Vanessa tameamea]XP_026499552.1 sarcolemmal membrane-associated protein [Vanessa tameamea]XP_026499553.1 sarcolemmal membrane-associated protein [Vanessa tameamea]XP_026499554.1 sarcolemmal membrane-associated protein [Vanessa tameamea]XP_026499555.1 sarcolemmal membrane-associated protein [Vanessa tameamea]XP_026499556.1 sarcolemmal membrane-associated protein [Vanessa tameame